MSSLLVKDGYIITMDSQDRILDQGSILVEDGVIAQLTEKDCSIPENVDTILEASDKIVMPGLINGHLHSTAGYWKGVADNLPLEPLLPYCHPYIGGMKYTWRDMYLRTMISCIEMLRTGTTTAIDDAVHMPYPSDDDPATSLRAYIESIDATVQAYEDCGMRALVTANVVNKPFYETIPYLEERLPPSLRAAIDSRPMPSVDQFVEMLQCALDLYGTKQRQVRLIVAPSAPQRCTDEFLIRLAELSERYDAPIVSHVQESKVQAVSGPIFYGMSMIEHLHELGILNDRMAIVHGVWLSDRDIELIADASASVIHCPVSNLKLGNGAAPVPKMLAAGINIAIGTDGPVANDSANMFEAMKLTALLHKNHSFDYDTWVSGYQALGMATRGGARAGMLQDSVGSLEVGKRADMVLLDRKSIAFLPPFRLTNQLVFCEGGNSVDTVIIDGEVVMKDKRIVTIDERSLMEEIRGAFKRLEPHIREAIGEGEALIPHLRDAYYQAVSVDVGFNRHWSQ